MIDYDLQFFTDKTKSMILDKDFRKAVQQIMSETIIHTWSAGNTKQVVIEDLRYEDLKSMYITKT